MRFTRSSALQLLPFLILIALGFGSWRAHATAWDLGRRSPVLSFDAAQYAVAARELAEHGRVATTFALPIELARNESAPWPLAVVQPGLVVVEALAFAALPPSATLPWLGSLREPRQREILTLFAPFWTYIGLGVFLAFAAGWLLARHAPTLSPTLRSLAAFVVGAAFLLDPEAQHFAVGGLTELPFTLVLVAAVWAVSTGWAARRPLLFGLLLGVAGAFRGNMLGLAPWLALAAAFVPAKATAGRRFAVVAFAALGFAAMLAPWWIYKFRAFGSPGWDLSWYGLWDGAAGHSWFSLSHLPVEPRLPQGVAAWGLLSPKLAHNVGELLPTLLAGPRALWIGALAVWLVVAKPPRALAVTAIGLLAVAIASLLTAALGASWMRYLFPSRVPLEAAGLLATWGLVAAATHALSERARLLLCVGVAALVLVWGARQTAQGLADARTAAAERGVPSVETMVGLADGVAAAVAEDEVVMSNLGPSLAWYARRPVLHLALTPADVAACRARVDFRQVVLVFRDATFAWPGWQEVVAAPEASVMAGWNVRSARYWSTDDGFQVVWLELGDR